MSWLADFIDACHDIWIVHFSREPTPKSWAEAFANAEKRFPNDKLLQQWNAEYEQQKRRELGERSHDA